jgi:hypothetical protein
MSLVKIWQIFFQDVQKGRLDLSFVPFDNKGVASKTLEFDVFQRLWRSQETTELDRWGAVSWRFAEKTGLEGDEFIRLVSAEPSIDVFYVNPYPRDEALYESSWVQGEVSHPGLIELAKAVLSVAGESADLVYQPCLSHDYSVCNYFVGTKRFWSLYIPFIEDVLSSCERNLAPARLRELYSQEADWQGKHNGACYLPFIVERLFPLFMRREGRGLRGRQLRLPKKEAQLSAALIELREMKDMAIRIHSSKIYGQWAQWRRAYIQSNYPKEWWARFGPLFERLPKTL